MIPKLKNSISHWLQKQPVWVFTVYASTVAFLTYSFMYAFRKPFTVAGFEGISLFGIDYKIWLITAQVMGYTLSKFMGIEYISALKSKDRALSILFLVGFAEASLFLFYLVPAPYNFVFMFMNGVPLGMIWGIVFSYLEGRKVTEMLGAGLCASFILASGVAKSVGELVMINWHVGEFAMPFVTGALFSLPIIITTFLLDSIPPPSRADVNTRTRRAPMNRFQRRAFLQQFMGGILFLVAAYIFLTVFREMRDNFAVEIWKSLGYSQNPAVFTLSEIPVAVFTLLSLALINLIRSNYAAFNTILFVVLIGFLTIIASTTLFTMGILPGEVWMVGIGIGLYLGYIPFNAFLFERLIAAFRKVSNTGFLIYVADAFGYLGSLGVMFYKNISDPGQSWISFFTRISFLFSFVGIVLVIAAFLFFRRKYLNSKNITQYEYAINSREPLLTLDTRTAVHQ
jgi:hypothetical protein